MVTLLPRLWTVILLTISNSVGDLAQSYPNAELEDPSPSGYETCPVNGQTDGRTDGRRTTCDCNSSVDCYSAELKTSYT